MSGVMTYFWLEGVCVRGGGGEGTRTGWAGAAEPRTRERGVRPRFTEGDFGVQTYISNLNVAHVFPFLCVCYEE